MTWQMVNGRFHGSHWHEQRGTTRRGTLLGVALVIAVLLVVRGLFR